MEDATLLELGPNEYFGLKQLMHREKFKSAFVAATSCETLKLSDVDAKWMGGNNLCKELEILAMQEVCLTGSLAHSGCLTGWLTVCLTACLTVSLSASLSHCLTAWLSHCLTASLLASASRCSVPHAAQCLTSNNASRCCCHRRGVRYQSSGCCNTSS